MATLQIPKPAGTVTSVNTKTGVVSLSTVDIQENGSLFFTSSRAAASISAVNTAGTQRGFSYNNTTGVLTISADYLAATPYTVVVRDSTGGIIGNKGTFTEMTVVDVLSCYNSIHTTDLYVIGTIYAAGGVEGGQTAISPVGAEDFIIEKLYINDANTLHVSAVLSLSSQTNILPQGGIVIDPNGGTSFTTIIPVVAIGFVDASGIAVSGARIQVSAWVPPLASFKFTMVSGTVGQQSVSIITGSCQTVIFS
jgi:hypothetical protein